MLSHVVIGASYALFTVVSLSYGFADIIVWLFAAEFIFTIGEMMYGPQMQKVISIMAPAEQRGFYFSVYGASHLLSRGLGPILGGILLSWGGGETLFTALAVVMALTGIVMYRVVRSFDHSVKLPEERALEA
ncbi:MFS transporter [Cohnella kolymensis]|uniref:MFS transporter n=1 Tax=Cohnella kolymensis TaxID=1590652 RepID=UPI000698383F|nr:MFS transporter [Cohnella kolymensis]